MKLEARLREDLRAAMRAQDDLPKRTLRMVRAALQNLAIAEGESEGTLSDALVLRVLTKQAKQRRDAIEQFVEGGREELAGAERDELAVIESYLPKAMDEGEVRRIVADVVSESGASGPSDMGRVMGLAIPRIGGRADGSLVSRLVRQVLIEADHG